jgi:hypothetical protein
MRLNGYSAAFIQLMNNWYGYAGIPVGKMAGGANSQDNLHEYVRAVCEYRMSDGRKAFHAPDTASFYPLRYRQASLSDGQ